MVDIYNEFTVLSRGRICWAALFLKFSHISAKDASKTLGDALLFYFVLNWILPGGGLKFLNTRQLGLLDEARL